MFFPHSHFYLITCLVPATAVIIFSRQVTDVGNVGNMGNMRNVGGITDPKV